MQPQIVTKPAFTVIGMLLRATPMSPEIPRLWDDFGPRMDEIPHQAEPNASYGLMDHFDEAMSHFDYMAGCSVTTVDELPEGMQPWEVGANTYAVFEATLPTLGEVWGHIYDAWLPTSGYQPAAGPTFERYGEHFDPADASSTLDIYIPVEKQA